MALSVTSFGDNTFAPGIFAETYVPDQLIAGDFKLITQPIVVASGTLARGTVLGQQTNFSVTTAPGAGNVGAGTIGSVSAVLNAKVGTYTATATSATNWTVTDPEGTSLAAATTGSAYNQGGIKFTITAGSPVFSAGDTFTLKVVDSVGNFIKSLVGASDGSQNPSAILVDNVDASAGPVQAGAYLTGEFNLNAVIYDTSWSPQALTTAMRAFSIFLKTVVSAADPGSSGEQPSG